MIRTFIDSRGPWVSPCFKVIAVVIIGVVIWQSLLPASASGGIPHLDKVLHFIVYAMMAAAIRLGWRNLWGGFILIFCASVGVGLEIAQGAMGLGRTASIADAAANVLGALFALFVLSRGK